jgi:predicted metal-dependent hydrolase
MKNACEVTLDQTEIRECIERCRRLAHQTLDEEARNSLEQLAEEYEAELDERPDSFMLGRAASGR